MELTHEEIVRRIFYYWGNQVMDDDVILKKLEDDYNITADTAETALELTKIGNFRAMMMADGTKYPSNNLESNPYVMAAIKVGFEKLGKSMPGQYYQDTGRKPGWITRLRNLLKF